MDNFLLHIIIVFVLFGIFLWTITLKTPEEKKEEKELDELLEKNAPFWCETKYLDRVVGESYKIDRSPDKDKNNIVHFIQKGE